MSNPVKKAVFPVAGLGTRFLPATKATPKEMLPIIDKPIIQYAVEEAIEAGIEEMIFVTSHGKRAIEDHFDSNYELEVQLAEQGKSELLAQIQNILPSSVTCVYIRQPKPLGLGHAILCARHIVGDDPFAVLLADDLIDCMQHKPCLTEMVHLYHDYQSHLIAIQQIAPEDFHKYGVVAMSEQPNPLAQLLSIIEKPTPREAPSNWAVMGRYIFSASIFQHLQKTLPGKNGEIQLTDAIQKSLAEDKAYGVRFLGKRFDCGTKLGYVQATLSYALKHPEYKDDLLRYLKTM